MENRILSFFFVISLAVFFFSCETEEAVRPFVLKSTTMEHTLSGVAFNLDNAEEKFVTIKWSAVDFGPSKTVKYSIEVAATGTDFAKPIDLSTTQKLADTITVAELNLSLARLGYQVGEEVSLDIRVRSWVNFIEAPGVSNALTVTVTPYLVVFPPLYVIGDARPGGWSLDNALELVSYTPGIYEGEGTFLNNGQFRFFYEPDWGAEQIGYPFFVAGTVDSDLEEVGDGDGNIRFTGLSGNYKIVVDVNTKTITIDPAGPPPPPASLFFVTAQTINLDDAIEFPGIAPGVYENTIIVPKNTKFRFFTGRSWTKEKWGWDSFEEELIDEGLADSEDDVSSFLFLSDESEYYKIVVNANDKSITVEPSAPPFPEMLYVNGGPYSWDFSKAAILLSTSVGTYEGMIRVQNGGDGFRFFSTNDWVQPQFGFDDFVNVPAVFSDGGGGDHNIVHSGAERFYKVIVSLIDKTITVSDPVLYIIGDDQGWNLGNAFALTWQSGGTFTGTTTFTNNSIFRFFKIPAWGQPGNELNFNSFITVDTEFTNGGGGDQNLRFNGTSGSHTVTVDLISSSVMID